MSPRTPALALGLLGVTLAASLGASCGSSVASGSPASSASGSGGASASTASHGSSGGGPQASTTVASSGDQAASTVTASTSQTSSGTGGQAAGTTASVGGGATCSPTEQAMKWFTMDKAPIKLPDQAALLDLQSVTLPAAEQILCLGTNLGDQFGDGTSVEAWGDNQEVLLDYDPATLDGISVSVFPGYLGVVTFQGSSGADTYTIPVQTQLTKNGQPFTLSGWSSADAQFAQQVDELCRGLMATFTNGALDPVGTTCLQSGKCTLSTFGTVGAVFFKPVGLALWVGDVTAAQPGPSTPTRLDVFKM